MKKITTLFAALLLLGACDQNLDTDLAFEKEQKKSLAEAHAQIGMPAIVNFQEKRMAKMIYEMRDQNILTHSYIMNEYRGCLVYLGASIGYGLPYATQYSNPQVDARVNYSMPQSEPNGLFMPDTASGTWVLLKDPNSQDVKPVYVEPNVLVFPFLRADMECK